MNYSAVAVLIWNNEIQDWAVVDVPKPYFPRSIVRAWYIETPTGKEMMVFGFHKYQRVSIDWYKDVMDIRPTTTFYRNRKTGSKHAKETYHFNTPVGLFRIVAKRETACDICKVDEGIGSRCPSCGD
jgi:hypothetical protein